MAQAQKYICHPVSPNITHMACPRCGRQNKIGDYIYVDSCTFDWMCIYCQQRQANRRKSAQLQPYIAGKDFNVNAKDSAPQTTAKREQVWLGACPTKVACACPGFATYEKRILPLRKKWLELLNAKFPNQLGVKFYPHKRMTAHNGPEYGVILKYNTADPTAIKFKDRVLAELPEQWEVIGSDSDDGSWVEWDDENDGCSPLSMFPGIDKSTLRHYYNYTAHSDVECDVCYATISGLSKYYVSQVKTLPITRMCQPCFTHARNLLFPDKQP